MKVKDVMVGPVFAVREITPLESVAQTMLERRIGCVVVVDGGGKTAGIITESDFLAHEETVPFSVFKAPKLFGRWLGAQGLEQVYRAATDFTARDVMKRNVETVQEEDPLEKVIEIMIRRDINRVPVVRDGKPVGIVARHDLLKLVLSKGLLK
jgi:CBS domain-containing protein